MTRLLIKAPAAAAIMAALLLLLCQAALAASPQVFYILDASGSMWGRAGDQMKIQAARQVMEQVVPQTPAEAAIGLAAYGHRTRGDCADVEILAMPGQISREEVLKKINAIQPKGKTPIAATLKLVAEKIGGADAETIMVLVSDGLETCDPDPCGVVKALKKSGIKFVLHVVGFGVDDQGKAQLSCLAEAGGGKYFGADDAASLLAAMEQVNKDVAQKIEQAKTTQVKAKTGLGKLHITMPKDAAISLAEIKIIRPKDEKVVKKAESAADATHPLISGEYKIVLGFANTNYKPPTDVAIGTVTVNPGETTELKLGGIYPNLAQGLNEAVAAVEIRQSGAKEPLLLLEPGGNDYYLFKPKPLPAGKYDFYVRNGRSPGSVLLAKDVEVTEGKMAVVDLDSGIRIKPPKSVNVKGWDLVASGTEDVYAQIRRRWDNDWPIFKKVLVMPGTYDVMIHVDGMDEPLPAGQGVKIEKGQTLEFDTGM